VQFAGARAASVRAAPLLNEHGAEIRKALAAGERWPELPAGSAPAQARASAGR